MDIYYARAGELDAILEIERESFTDPWSREAMEYALEDTNGGILVAAEDGQVRGFAVFHCAYEESELYNLAVSPRFRGRGAGRELLEAVLTETRRRGAEKIFLEVRESNAAARGLYQSAGFGVIGVRKAYYERPKEDAIIMELELLER